MKLAPVPWFNWFSFAYLWLGLQLIAVELYGVARKGRRDTISENWWLIQHFHPITARLLMTVFLTWLYLHFCWREQIEHWLGVQL